jgi:hypothetical protein
MMNMSAAVPDVKMVDEVGVEPIDTVQGADIMQRPYIIQSGLKLS